MAKDKDGKSFGRRGILVILSTIYQPLKILAAKAKRGTSGIEFFLSELKEVYSIYIKAQET